MYLSKRTQFFVLMVLIAGSTAFAGFDLNIPGPVGTPCQFTDGTRSLQDGTICQNGVWVRIGGSSISKSTSITNPEFLEFTRLDSDSYIQFTGLTLNVPGPLGTRSIISDGTRSLRNRTRIVRCIRRAGMGKDAPQMDLYRESGEPGQPDQYTLIVSVGAGLMAIKNLRYLQGSKQFQLINWIGNSTDQKTYGLSLYLSGNKISKFDFFEFPTGKSLYSRTEGCEFKDSLASLLN